MSKARNLADLLDSNGDVKTSGLDNVPAADLVNDTSPQLGGNLDGQSYNITTTGKVGIGTSSPTSEIDVVGAGGGNGEIRVSRTSGTGVLTQAQSALGKFGTTTNHNLQFMTNSGGRMTIDTNGRVGIGTSSPDNTLHIKADQPIIKLEDNQASGGYHQLGNSNSDGTLVIYADADGTNSSTANMRFSVSGTERMRIDSSGRVTTPSQVGFKANYAGNGFNVSSSGGKITQDREIYDIGGCYDPTNSRFTAPISGRYLMTFHIIYIMTGNSMVLAINVNGYNGGSKGRSVHFTNNISGHWQNIQMHQILDLNANDYVELTYSGSNTGNFHGDDWNHWSMMLLG